MKLKTIICLGLALVLGSCAKSAPDLNAVTLRDDPAPLSITLAQVEIESRLMNHFEVSIQNTGKADVVILKPLDGSLWSWRLPYYSFIVKDQSGKMLTMMGRCGNTGLWGGTKWPDDYLLVLKPGEQFKKTFPLIFVVPEE